MQHKRKLITLVTGMTHGWVLGLLVIVLGHGTARQAGIVFAATMLVRAPVYVFQGVAASLLPNFTLLGSGDRAQLRRVLRRTMLVLAGAPPST